MDDQNNLINQISRRFLINLLRVHSLNDISIDKINTQEEVEHLHEVLRSSVVFMHAILEDTLREIARAYLSELSSDELDSIPLVGISITGQPRKFFLGGLHTHRGKTVDELISESICEYLNKISFNSTNDISNMLGKLNVDIAVLQKYFPSIAEAIKRRHQIVHHADMELIDEEWKICPINTNNVKKWTLGIGLFLSDLLSILGTNDSTITHTSFPDYGELTELKNELSDIAKEAGVFD